MDGNSELLAFLLEQRDEARRLDFLKSRGYSDPQQNEFGLNQWTQRLLQRSHQSPKESQENIEEVPDHLVSFLAVPSYLHEECIDMSSTELIDWISSQNWKTVPGVF